MYMQPLYLRWKDGAFLYDATLWEYRKKIHAKAPLVPPPGAAAPSYLDESTGWGDDIYYKGAWILHTLREEIGDEAFEKTLRLFVYGRDDPRPGNFQPVLRTSDDYQHIVEQVTGRDWGWFFETYLRQGPLPRLLATREGAKLRLAWQSPAQAPFAMPIEVSIAGKLVRLPMTGGRGSVDLPSPGAHVVIDPHARVLRYDPAIEAWQKQEADNKKAAEAAKAKG
jgi:aminopeptidase N